MTGSSKGKEPDSLLSRLKRWCSARAGDGHVYDEAAEHFLRLQEEQVDLEDWQTVQGWLSQSHENQRVMGSMDRLWRDLEKMDGLPWPDEEDCLADNYDGRRPLPIPQARQRGNQTRTADKRDSHSRGWQIGLSLSGAVSACLLAVLFLAPMLTSPKVYQTAIGEHRLFTLEDGSQMLLGGKTRARVDYAADVRQIYLDSGEALFTVAKNRQRPFLVSSGNANVVAVGTQFNVRRLGRDVLVSVVEGIVNVSNEPIAEYKRKKLVKVVSELSRPLLTKALPEKATRLTVGQQIKLSPESTEKEVKTITNDEALAWRDGRLLYSGNPLSAVIADVNRYHNRPIRILDDDIGQLIFSGTVREDEIEDWLNGLQTAFGLEVIATDEQVIIKKGKNRVIKK